MPPQNNNIALRNANQLRNRDRFPLAAIHGMTMAQLNPQSPFAGLMVEAPACAKCGGELPTGMPSAMQDQANDNGKVGQMTHNVTCPACQAANVVTITIAVACKVALAPGLALPRPRVEIGNGNHYLE